MEISGDKLSDKLGNFLDVTIKNNTNLEFDWYQIHPHFQENT